MKSLKWRALVADRAECLGFENTSKIDLIGKLQPLFMFAVICWALIGFVQAAGADGANLSNDASLALREFIQTINTEQPKLASPEISAPVNTRTFVSKDSNNEIRFADANSALTNFVQLIEAKQPKFVTTNLRNSRGETYSALADFVQLVAAEQANPSGAAKPRVAKAVKSTAKSSEDGFATLVGSKVCVDCHSRHTPELIKEFQQTLMGRLQLQGKMQCETCHGPGSEHVRAGGGRGVGGLISFRKDDTSRTVEENNAICLGCHAKGDRILWQGSTHEERGLACTNCHSVMRDLSRKHQLKTRFEIDTCFECHKNKRSEMWRTSHMPIREGRPEGAVLEAKMTCSTCHNPHGSFSESLLRTATINDTCYKCHAEKRGPFLWEHAPVRENCANCHEPHGSNNEFLLKISRPRLCQQCHGTGVGHPANPRNPFSIYAINHECQNCHSQHHGSNSPAGVRYQR